MNKTPASQPSAQPADAQTQRRELLDAQRHANENQPRNFKEDALDEKVVSVEPDGTGPTPTETFDPEEDRHAGKADPADSHPTEGQRTANPARPQTR